LTYVKKDQLDNIQDIVYTEPMPPNLEDAEIEWMGDSKEVLSSWPDEIKATLGFALRKVQRGEIPSDSKLLPGTGQGVRELRDGDAHIWYRVAYLPRNENVVYVLHAFEKKGAKTPKNAVATIKERFKVVREMMKSKKKEKP
jgi:phage-related protein